jgi:tetratricopeptide (TPR) repeat protein
MTTEVWLERGGASRDAGRFSEALKHFQTAIELDDNCAEAWYGRAGTLFDLAQYRPAMEAYEHARKLDSPFLFRSR